MAPGIFDLRTLFMPSKANNLPLASKLLIHFVAEILWFDVSHHGIFR